MSCRESTPAVPSDDAVDAVWLDSLDVTLRASSSEISVSKDPLRDNTLQLPVLPLDNDAPPCLPMMLPLPDEEIAGGAPDEESSDRTEAAVSFSNHGEATG